MERRKIKVAKLSKRNGFLAITEAIENNDEATANAIFSILSQSIQKDRDNNSFTEYIELSPKQAKLFKGKYEQYLSED